MSIQSDKQSSVRRRPHRGRWVVGLLFTSFCIMAVLSWQLARALGATPGWGFQPPAMAAAQRSAEDVIGDLGGMPVKISRFVAEYVEYEGDPGWSGPRQGPPPVRTYASRLMSFGFDVRYPDMSTKTRVMWDDRARYNIYNTPWIHVGITTGPYYPGRGFMNRLDLWNGPFRSYHLGDEYDEVRQKRFGLTEYRLKRADLLASTQPARLSDYGQTIYLNRDLNGNVITRIDCSNVPHEAALCEQDWDLGEQGVAAEVRVMYRRGHLENWRDIQRKVTEVVLGFRADHAQPEAMPMKAELVGSE